MQLIYKEAKTLKMIFVKSFGENDINFAFQLLFVFADLTF